MRRRPAAAPMARAAPAPATPASPAAAARTGGSLARLDAPRLAALALEPSPGIAKEARKHVGIAATGGRDDFEYGVRLVEVWTMDKPARAARRRNQMR